MNGIFSRWVTVANVESNHRIIHSAFSSLYLHATGALFEKVVNVLPNVYADQKNEVKVFVINRPVLRIIHCE